LTEVTWDLLVGKDAPPPAQSPIRISAGARFAIREDSPFALQGIVEVSPSSRPIVDAGQPLVPVEPRFGAMISLLIRIGAPAGRVLLQEPEAAPAVEAIPALVLRGRVLDEEHQGISGANLTLTTTKGEGEGKRAVSDTEGGFELPGLEPGEADLAIEAEGRATSHLHVVISAGDIPPIEANLSLKLPEGQIRGVVRNLTGKPIAASIRVEPLGLEVSSDGQGSFRVDVPPGRYDVVLRAKGYAEQRRNVVVDRDGVVLLNVDLRGSQ
jgi:hypothetical protein